MPKSRRSFVFAVIAFAAIFAVVVFQQGCQSTPPVASSPTAGSAPKPAVFKATVAPKPFRIATFNIANLSLNKLKKADVVATLVMIVRKYDVIAVQELDDASLKAPEAFLALINAASGPKYAVSFSSESGATATTGQREQYAFYYNTATVDSIAPSRLYPDPQDEFIREPFAAQFRAKSGPSFVLLTIHTAPAHAPQEIAALGSAVTWAHATYAGEAGIIVLGDFNAGTNYVKQKEIEAIRARDLPYTWIVPDGTATTLAKTPQTHDRIVVTGELARSRTTNWGVDHAFTSETVSDHFPVWAEFDFTNK